VGPEMTISLARETLKIVLALSAPVLIAAMAVSLTVSIGQVLTSIQDSTIATVPRLAAVAGAIMLLAPWMLRKLVGFTVQLLSDFRPYLL
jgi:flagellar biosynthetic protein FliQ